MFWCACSISLILILYFGIDFRFRMKCRGKYTVSTLLSERMTQLGSSDEKKDLSALVMSMEEEGEL